jgi:hypothetical protein
MNFGFPRPRLKKKRLLQKSRVGWNRPEKGGNPGEYRKKLPVQFSRKIQKFIPEKIQNQIPFPAIGNEGKSSIPNKFQIGTGSGEIHSNKSPVGTLGEICSNKFQSELNSDLIPAMESNHPSTMAAFLRRPVVSGSAEEFYHSVRPWPLFKEFQIQQSRLQPVSLGFDIA